MGFESSSVTVMEQRLYDTAFGGGLANNRALCDVLSCTAADHCFKSN